MEPAVAQWLAVCYSAVCETCVVIHFFMMTIAAVYEEKVLESVVGTYLTVTSSSVAEWLLLSSMQNTCQFPNHLPGFPQSTCLPAGLMCKDLLRTDGQTVCLPLFGFLVPTQCHG